MLKRGSKGIEVTLLQEQLYPDYYRGRIDGDFGPLTEAAVKAFQSVYFATGVFDDRTEVALGHWLDEHEIKLEVPVPRTHAQLIQTFGRIEYRDIAKGQITITNGWARENVIKVDLPIVGKKWIHRKLEPNFVRALTTIQHLGLAGKIETFGTWCPRHICHDPDRELSLHSWAIAVDINARRYRYGSQKRLPPGIVRAFCDVGFVYGADFSTPDPMHFQYRRYD